MVPPNDIEAAARALREGRLVAFPTETVYGLGADATNGEAVARVYAAKGRPSFNPLIAHVPDAESAFALGDFTPEAKALARAFWPGPLSLVVPRRADCPVSLLASSGLDSIAIRVPSHPVAIELLKAVARPVVAPSANPSGKISPTTADHVRRHLKDKVAMVLDGGRCKVGVESSVVSFLDDGPKLLRHGGIPKSEIEKVLGHAIAVESHSARPHAPGQLMSHYAPHAELRLNAAYGEAFQRPSRFLEELPENLTERWEVARAVARFTPQGEREKQRQQREFDPADESQLPEWEDE